MRFSIYNHISGHVFGEYEGADEHEAITACVRDAGYESIEAMEQTLERACELRADRLPEVIDNGEFFNVTAEGVEFTADKQAREWGLAGDDNWPALEAAAERVGIPAGEFWSHFGPLLNAAVGWDAADAVSQSGRYIVHLVADEGCDSIDPEALGASDDAAEAAALAAKHSADGPWGAAVRDTVTGQIDFGFGFGIAAPALDD